jgi:transcriptional regulator with XRE-family HTH domain
LARHNQSRQIQPVSGPRKAFGQALREFREAKGVSQERLATDAGVDRSYVSLVERGIQGPTIQVVVKLARALGVRPVVIVGRMEAILAETEKSSGG